MLSKYSDFVLRWRYLIVLITIAAILVLGAGGKNLVFTNDYRYFFSEDNPRKKNKISAEYIFSLAIGFRVSSVVPFSMTG